MKKILSSFLVIMFLISSFGFADEVKSDKVIERYLGIARIITYVKNGDKSQHYALINGKEEKIDLDGILKFDLNYDLLAINRNPLLYKILKVETYENSAFGFGTNVYNNLVYDADYKNDFFTAQENFMDDDDEFKEYYFKYSVKNLSFNDYAMTNGGIKTNVVAKLDRSKAYHYTYKFNNNGKEAIEFVRKLLGGRNIDIEANKIITNAYKISQEDKENLENQDGYLYIIPYVMTLEKKAVNDLEVVKIIADDEYTAGFKTKIYVKVRNNTDREIDTEVDLNGQSKKIKLYNNSEDIIIFDYIVPNKDTILTAEINKTRSVDEDDYKNNIKSKKIKIVKERSNNSACSSSVTWTEQDSRLETETYTYSYGCTRPDGKRGTCTQTKTIQVTRWYNFTYEATMNTTVNIKDDRDKQLNNVTTKSGYGVKIDTSSDINIRQISGAWDRKPTKKPSDLTTATATTSWKVKKIHKQKQVINLVGDGKNKFTTGVNKSSETKAKVIYTDIDLKDGRHSVTVRVSGAKIDGKELCTSTVIYFYIKGNMYEDYKVS